MSDDMGESDEILAERAARGDVQALRGVHRRYASMVFGMSVRALGAPAAEEIVQDVFVALWKHREAYDPARGTLKSWILRIARNRVVNELRHRKRHPAEMRDPEHFDDVPATDAAADDAHWLAHRRETIRAAVEALPVAQAQALGLAFFDDLSHEQVAATLGIPIGTAKSRIRQGLRKLAVSLATVAGVVMLVVWVRRDRHDRGVQDRALRMVTSSDVVPLRMTATPGFPPAAHGTYRAHPADDVGVVTVSALPRLPAGASYRVWLRRGAAWHPLGAVVPDGSARAVLVVEDRAIGAAPDGVEVTVESQGMHTQPTGNVVLQWPPPSLP